MAKNQFTSIEDLRSAADRGDSSAQEKLALAYLEGWNGEKNYQKARDWYERAAAQDDPGGHFGLAILHAHGLGTPSDPVTAYMRLILMKRRGDVLKARWNAETARRMLDCTERLAESLNESERARAQRLAEDWVRANGRS